jgi:SAM-dependent methyltransferase
LNAGSRVLDMGCANGRLTELISDATGAHVTGVDISPVGIEQAQTRTSGKRDRLVFDVGNIVNWRPLPVARTGSKTSSPADRPESTQRMAFDTLLLLDTLYFVDVQKALDHATHLVAPGGQIGIFFSQWIQPGSRQEQLRPKETAVGRALHRLELPFWTWDFSEQEIAHWKRKLDIGARMRPAFEAEDNLWLYRFRLGEAKNHARTIGPHTRSRYLYLVSL